MTTSSEYLKRESIDSLVTGLKLSDGSTLVVHGKTTPEGMPFVFLLALDRQHRGVTNAVIEFASKAPELARTDNTEGWADLHRAELQAKKELGADASSFKLIARMLEILGPEPTPAPRAPPQGTT